MDWKEGDRVEVELGFPEAPKGTWKKGTIMDEAYGLFYVATDDNDPDDSELHVGAGPENLRPIQE